MPQKIISQAKEVYESAECYIDRETLKMLIEARDIFKRDGYRVKNLGCL